MFSLSVGGTDLTPSTPAVFFPWLSCVTRLTARSLAALDAHQELLDFVDCLGVATFTSLKDALLHAVNGCLDFLPRELFPGHIRLVRWIAIHATSTSFFHMIVSTSAFAGFLDNPNISDLRLAPAHRIDQR